MRAALISFVLFAAACNTSVAPDRSSSGKREAALEPDQRMAWWRDARFGMFIHWGLYAIPAGEWKGKTSYGEWIRHSAQIPVDTYAEFQKQWNPVGFDAEAWAKMAADAGMKYLVITSKHHDGFCLWDSPQTDWDVGNTAHGRDILAELAAACRRHGVRFGTYHSIMDWHHDDYLPRRKWEVASRPVGDAEFGRFEEYLHGQVAELVEKYRPAVMWFDGEWESTWNHERGKKLFAHCRELAPEMIVNNRVDVHRGGMGGFSASDEACGDFATPEQQIPATGMPGVDWESCMTMNSHWGWNQSDPKWKSTKTLVRNLIDIASKGGNYLLNIGPKADGTFPAESVTRLQETGQWMRRNGEAIYGTTASVFDALEFGRCTVRAASTESRLYLHVFDRPEDGRLVLPGLGNQVRRAWRLDRPEQELPFERVGADVVIRAPNADLDPIATVVAVEVQGQPIVYRKPTIEVEWPEFVRSTRIVIRSGPGLVARYTLDGSEPTASSPIADEPIAIDSTCTVHARVFHSGRPVSGSASATLTKVSAQPAIEPVAEGPGLRRAVFRESWDVIDDSVRHRVAEETTVATTIHCGDKPGDGVVHRLTGYLDVPADELYRLALASDDGSKLWIDGELVVDNDGLHGTREVRGAAALGKGLHAITVLWFNKSGGAELSLRWARPGKPFVPVPASALSH